MWWIGSLLKYYKVPKYYDQDWRFGTKVEKDMEHESQGSTTSDRCPRSNTDKVKKLAKGNMYWSSDNRVAENYPPTHCLNPPKGSWGLRKLVVAGPEEHKSTCYVIRVIR